MGNGGSPNYRETRLSKLSRDYPRFDSYLEEMAKQIQQSRAQKPSLVRWAQNFGIDTESRILAFLFFFQFSIKTIIVFLVWLAIWASVASIAILFILDSIGTWKSLLRFTWNNTFALIFFILISLSLLSFLLAKGFGAIKAIVGFLTKIMK